MKKTISAIIIVLAILLTACENNSNQKTHNRETTAAPRLSENVAASQDTEATANGAAFHWTAPNGEAETEQSEAPATVEASATLVPETEHIPEAPIEGKEYHLNNFTIVRDANGKDWITGYDGDDMDVRVMSWDFSGSLLHISGIGPGAFADKPIKSFYTNMYFTEIGERAFENCTQLEEVNLMLEYVPKDQPLVRIGYRAFANTPALKSFIFPEDITFIETEVLCGSGVQEIRVEGAYQIKSRAFADCPNLTDLYLPVTAMVFADDMLTSYEGLIIHCPQVAKAWEWAKERHIAALAEENIIGQR